MTTAFTSTQSTFIRMPTVTKVVIFGIKDYAELAHYYLESDSPYEVVAFCVHRQFMPQEAKFRGLPIVAIEDLEVIFPTDAVKVFAPMSPKNMNRDRRGVFEALKGLGYSFISYVSSRATVLGNAIGENCFILENNTLQPFTKIGNNVTLWSGNHIGHHGEIHDHVTVTSHVVISGHCSIGPHSFLGVNATLKDRITLAEGTFIAMAAAITTDTEPWSVYKGNPAAKMSIPSTKIRFN